MVQINLHSKDSDVTTLDLKQVTTIITKEEHASKIINLINGYCLHQYMMNGKTIVFERARYVELLH